MWMSFVSLDELQVTLCVAYMSNAMIYGVDVNDNICATLLDV